MKAPFRTGFRKRPALKARCGNFRFGPEKLKADEGRVHGANARQQRDHNAGTDAIQTRKILELRAPSRATGSVVMPVISMFYGIIIRLYLLDNRHHNLPHIHAKYAEFEASLGIADGDVLAGDLPRKQLRLVQAWIELHRDELVADWELAANGETPYKIEPL